MHWGVAPAKGLVLVGVSGVSSEPGGAGEGTGGAAGRHRAQTSTQGQSCQGNGMWGLMVAARALGVPKEEPSDALVSPQGWGKHHPQASATPPGCEAPAQLLPLTPISSTSILVEKSSKVQNPDPLTQGPVSLQPCPIAQVLLACVQLQPRVALLHV